MKEHIGKYAILYLLLALVVGFFIGKTDWFKNLFTPSAPSIPSDGTACKTADGSDGKYNGGVCVKNIGIPVDTNLEGRISSPCDLPYGGGKGTRDANGICQPLISSNRRDAVNKIISEMNSSSARQDKTSSCNKLASLCAGDPAGSWCWNWYDKVCGGMARNTTAPATIMLTASSMCSKYTTANPYSYLGCSYVFGGYINAGGIRKCLLKKVSCP